MAYNVLIVDDSDSSLSVMAAYCMELGHRCVTASNPADALALISAEPGAFDVVILDNYFDSADPSGDSASGSTSLVVAGLREFRRVCQGFLVGISGDIKTRDGFITKGADYFMHKPVSLTSFERMFSAAEDEFSLR